MSAEDFESFLIPIDEKSYPDWRAKLSRGLKRLDAGQGVELESFLKKQKKRKSRAKARKLFLSPEACGDLQAITEPLRTVVIRRLRLLRQFPESACILAVSLGLASGNRRNVPHLLSGDLRGVEVVYIRHCKRKLFARTD